MAVKLSLVLLVSLFISFSSASTRFEEVVRKFKSRNDEGNHWALVVAGSSGYYNYRHQADACHAYHVLKANGFKDENIVVMMYDDIAGSTQNPTPGIIINHPKGKDVYAGVPKDYTKKDVTPQNFLNILRGRKSSMEGIGSGKVIASGPNDNVFVNFVDHGAPGILGFPTEMLHKSDLIMALEEMFENKQYKQMVMYIEACESGSMFDGSLKPNWNIFGTTAANTHESSYACYYDKVRNTYLGDVYSVRWMEDSDQENLQTETLQQQFLIVRKETNTSHVMEYGDMSLSSEHVGDFQGTSFDQNLQKSSAKKEFTPITDAVPQEDVPMAILYNRLQDVRDHKELSEIRKEMYNLIALKAEIEVKVQKIVSMAARDVEQAIRVNNVRHSLTKHVCYKSSVNLFHDICYNLGQNNFALRHMYKLLNLCEEGIPVEIMMKAIFTECKKH